MITREPDFALDNENSSEIALDLSPIQEWIFSNLNSKIS